MNRAIPATEFLSRKPGSAFCSLIALIVLGLTASFACAENSSVRVREYLNAGWLFERAADEKLRSPFIIGPALIIVGLLMGWGERLGSEDHDLGQVSLLDSILVGVAQAFAVIPGVSRSGSTMNLR